jgi:nitrogen fixation protein NifQ
MMPAANSPSALQLQAQDASLIQRVVRHVLESQVDGRLPLWPWHSTLTEAQREAVHTRWPLQAALWDELDKRVSMPASAAEGHELLTPLRDLLLEHRAVPDPVLTLLANTLAAACFGSHHLWEDLGADGREEVSRLMLVGFPALHEANHRNLRWKRHLFLTLGERLGREDLRPPKCDDCDQFDLCFAGTAIVGSIPISPAETST